MADKRWKRAERNVAKALGTNRNPNTGEHRTDIDTERFAIEHKLRKHLPKLVTDALAQVRAAQEEGDSRIPLVIMTESRQGVKAKRYVIMDFSDFLSML